MDLSELRRNVTRHPWELSRAQAIETLVNRHRMAAAADILDLGCGDGFTGRHVRERLGNARYVGFDPHLLPEQCAAWSSGDGDIQFLRDEPPFDARFDLVLLCDVIEHVEDPTALLRSAWSRTRRGGLMVVTVPAFQSLFGEHDRALKHFRRYSLGELRKTLRNAGVSNGASGYWFGSLILPRALAVVREKLRGTFSPKVDVEAGIGDWNGGPFATRSITALLNLDNSLMSWLSGVGVILPGLTAWAIVRRAPRDP